MPEQGLLQEATIKPPGELVGPNKNRDLGIIAGKMSKAFGDIATSHIFPEADEAAPQL